MHGSLEIYDNWKDATYKSQRLLTALLKWCFNKCFIHINNYQGSDAVSECCPTHIHKKKGYFFPTCISLQIMMALQRKCNLCREATASQMKSCILASLTSKTYTWYKWEDSNIQGYSNTFVNSWAAEMISGHSCQSWHTSCVAALAYLKGIPTKINDANWCHQNLGVLPTKTRTHRAKAVPVMHRRSFTTTFCHNFHLVHFWCSTALLQVM